MTKDTDKKLTFIDADDWAVIYIGDISVGQGHTIKLYEVLDQLGIDYEHFFSGDFDALEGYIAYNGHFPETLAKAKELMNERTD